jgi:hypothetical protein
MAVKKFNPKLMQAKILGRVERLMGSDSTVNPFPVRSKEWEAFREGWFLDLDDPVTRYYNTTTR